jgi:hypothetical protein
LILRKFAMSSDAPASGQGHILNKVLTMNAGNDSRMVNAPPPSGSNGVPFTQDRPESAGWPLAWPTGVPADNFDATSGLCQQPQEFIRMKGLQTWRKPPPAAEALLP